MSFLLMEETVIHGENHDRAGVRLTFTKIDQQPHRK